MENYKRIIGDGRTPNKYYVSISNDYSYIHDGNSIDWIGDIIPSFKSKGQTFPTPFKTYSAAMKFAQSFVMGEIRGGFDYPINRVTIEDRLTGELYEKTVLFNPETGQSTIAEYEYTQFSRDRLKELGYRFE